MNGDEVVEVARRIAVAVLRPNAERVDREGKWPASNIRALLDGGLGGLVVPVDAGGLGFGLEGVARVCEVLAAECASSAISIGMHFVGSAVIAAKATPAQRERYLRPIARGEHLTTLALSEPGTGVHFYLPETQLVARGDDLLVRGAKSFVTNGGFADSYVLSVAPAGVDAAPGEFSCVVVRERTEGLSWAGDWTGWGMRGNSARSAQLVDVRIDRDDLLGEQGDEIWFMFNVVVPYFLMAMSATYLGVATAAFEAARAHLTERQHSHSGAALADHNIIQHRIGTLWAQVQRTRSLVYDAARLADLHHPDALPALCSAKAEVAEAGERVTAEAMSLVGGRGYAAGHVLQRLYRDVRAAHVMAPTTDMLRTWTGRSLLGRPLLGD